MGLEQDMDDWWADFKREEEEHQQFELSLAKIREEMAKVKVFPQTSFELTGGSSLKGSVRADYAELVRAFGNPMEGDGSKTQVEWVVLFEVSEHDTVLATIYDWKKYDQRPVEVTHWNIGGHDYRAADMVIDYLNYLRDMDAVLPVFNERVSNA